MKTFELRKVSMVLFMWAIGLCGAIAFFVNFEIGLFDSDLIRDEIINQSEISFYSRESKDSDGQSVYNTIKYFKFKDQEVWMMNQIHRSEKASQDQPDRLAIVVRKNLDNKKQAYFYQLPAGRLQWDPSLENKTIKARVNCLLCHSNGPRLLRPENNFLIYEKEFWLLYFMNKKILKDQSIQSVFNEGKPFDHSIKRTPRKLNWKSCSGCHNGQHRAVLTTQQWLTIKYLVQNKLMPPLEWDLLPNEKALINKFLSQM